METETLEKIGLTKNESIVYLTLVKSGTIKTAKILKKSGLNSGRIYDTLESLKHKGLISESNINGVKHFTASPPNQLKEYFQQKINRFWINWSPKRISKKIIAKHLFSEKSEFFDEFKKMKCTEAKFLEGITPVTIDIFGTKTALIMNYKDPISCILIQDENTVQSFRQFFYQLWKIAK